MSEKVDEAKDLGDAVVDRETDWRVLRSLDADVAELVMKWTRFPKPMHPTDNRTINGVLYCPPGMTTDSGRLNVVPPFSSDMNDALQVVERLSTRRIYAGMGNSEKGWQVAFFAVGIKPYRADAPTLAEAICRAALHATECLSISDRQNPRAGVLARRQ